MSPDHQRSSDAWSPDPPADVLTIYGWSAGSRWLEGAAREAGLSENALLVAASILGVLALPLLWFGHFLLGLIAGWAFLVASLGVERGRWPSWALAILPLFWWWGWSHGLAVRGEALTPVYGLMMLWAVIGGGIADLAIRWLFRRRFGLVIDDWRRFDSRFALAAAGPSINLALLAIGFLIGHPRAALVVIAWWSIVTAIVHAVRLAQASEQKARGNPVAGWRAQ